MVDPVVRKMIEYFHQMGFVCREQGCSTHYVEQGVLGWMCKSNLTSRVLYDWLVVAFQDGYNGIVLVFE